MVEQQTTWAGRGASARTQTRTRTRAARIGVEIHPIQWLLNYQAAMIVALLTLAVFVFVLRVNGGAFTNFNLNNDKAQLTVNNAKIATLWAQRDSLLAESRIDAIATTRLHMLRPSLNSALWLTVYVPSANPRPPVEPRIATGPLVWMRSASRAIEDSL